MEGRPRSIYAVARPLRVAYLVPSSDNGIDISVTTIIYLQSILAGRYCPIVATDGNTIAPNDISLLLHYDPDVVKALTPLSDRLIRLLDAMLSPFAVEVQYAPPEEIWPVRPQISDLPLTIDPSIDQISATGLASSNKSQRVNFVCNKNADSMVRRFLAVNFGVISSEEDAQQLPDMVGSLPLPVNSWSDLAAAFTTLNSYKPRFFPIQISALPNTLPDTQHSDGQFCLVVGDSLDDILCAWNRILNLPSGFRTAIRTVWVPRELFDHYDVAQMFARWAKTIADTANFGDPSLVFTSASMIEDEVASIAGNFRNHISGMQVVRTSPTLQEVDWQHSASELGPNASLYPVIANRAVVKVELPGGAVTAQRGRHWMIDLHVEIDETSQPIRFNSLRWLRWAKSAVINRRVASPGAGRIMGGGVLSICVDKPDISLDVQLPERPASLLFPLIAADRSSYNPFDARRHIIQSNRYGVRTSEKGRYFEGFIEAFGGLDDAFEVLSQPFWREVFDGMSGASPRKNTNLVQQMSDRLKKSNSNLPLTDTASDLLAQFLLDKAKEAILRSKDLSMAQFDSSLKRHIDEYNSNKINHQVLAPDNEALRSQIDDLVRHGAMIQGLRPKCQRCGWPNWLAVSTLSREITCSGCGMAIRIPAEPTWYYRLNSLVQDGISQHGLVPVALVLGALQRNSNQSFIALPSVDLFDGPDKLTDLDIACAQDGSLIIGEIKTSVGSFKTTDFSKMENIARRIIPRKVLFSSLDPQPSQSVAAQIADLRTKLAPDRIEVEWYSLPYNVFDRRPYFAKLPITEST